MMDRQLLRLGVLVLLVSCSTSLRAGTSNSLLDLSPDGKRLLVTNSDNGTITLVDTTKNQVVREIAVGEKPEGVAWIGNGPLALATVYREDQVVFVDVEQGQIVKRLAVPDEPYGVVTNKAGTRGWVTHEYPGLVTEIDLQSQKIVRQMEVGPFVRGLALSPDEKRLYVTEFYTANMHALDLASGKVADTWRSQSTDNQARHVIIHPTRPKAYVTHIRSRVRVIDGGGAIFPHLTVYDLVPASARSRRKSVALDTYNGVYVTTNSWESAISPDGKMLYTVYAGTDDMNVSQVVDDDYSEIEAVGRPIQLGKNPRAVRVSPDSSRVYVYNTLDFEVVVYPASARSPLATIKVCSPPKTPEWVRGKILFSTAKPPLSERRWVACASCHPDGHSDGRVWHNPEGMRKTPPLMGLAHTHPLHWSADRDEVQDFEFTIRSPLMRGRGLVRGPIPSKTAFQPIELDVPLSGRSADLDALAVYTNSFEFTLSPHIPAPGKLSESAERGRKLFFSKEVACASCHSGPYFSDSTRSKPFKVHDVGTGQDDPSEKMGPKYDTPTLLGVYRSAPYLHHGKAKTLMDVLTTENRKDQHGRTSHLQPQELRDLVEFLRSLPYEMPPSRTANTVKHSLSGRKD